MKTKRRPKKAVPQGRIWWRNEKRHPLNHWVGRVIHRLRRRCGWALDGLAAAAGLTKSYLYRLERGLHSPSLEVQLRLEAVFSLVRGGLVRLAECLMRQT